VAEGVVTMPRHLRLADTRRSVPAHPGARQDAIETALHVLGEEDRRLEQLGLDDARTRCRDARRFWGFVGALYTLADADTAVDWKEAA